MTYFYKEISPTISRPIIQVIVKSKDKFAIYPVLVDSGADYCIFSLELAEKLDIALSKTVVDFRGVGKDKVSGRWGEVEIKMVGHTYTTKALFAKITDFGHGILGQNGFFDHFDVNFSLSRQTIEVIPIKEIH